MFFVLSFLFFIYKIREQEGGTILPREKGWHQWEGGGDEQRRVGR
jgi:hypothetical protein